MSIEQSTEHVEDHYVEALARFRGDIRMMEQVLATMIERGVPRTAAHLGLMLDEYLAGRSLRKALVIIEELEGLGVAIDPVRQYDVALASATAGNLTDAIASIDRLVADQRDPAPAQASSVLDLLLNAKKLPHAWSLFRRMRARQQHPSREALLVLLADALQRRAAKDSVAVMHAFVTAGHRLPDGRGGMVVRMLVGLGQFDRAIEILQLLDAEAEAGRATRPDDQVRALLLTALASKGNLEAVLQLADPHGRRSDLSGFVRNAILAAFIAAGDFEGAWREAEQMWSDACLPTGANLEALLDLTLTAGNVARAAGVLDLLLVVGVPVSSQRSGAVLRAEMAADGLDRVLPVAAQLLDQGLVFDRATARDLVERLVRARRLDEARAWLDRFRSSGTLTQGKSYGSLLTALATARRVDEAVTLLEEMLAANIRPESTDLARLVSGRVKADDVETAERVLLAASSIGVHADEATLRELMWTQAKQSDAAGVERTIGLLTAAGIPVDERHEKARAWASGATPRRLDETDAVDPDASSGEAAAGAPAPIERTEDASGQPAPG